MENFPAWLAGLLLLAAIVLFVVLRRERKLREAAEVTAEEQQREHDADLAEARRQADVSQARVRQDAVAAEARMREDFSARLAQEQQRTAAFERAALKSMEWDASARQVILDLCVQHSVVGALLTGVLFVPEDTTAGRRYATQIDHVLVVDGRVLLIEGKRWSGVVLDGVRPEQLHPALGRLLPTPPRVGPFAIHAKSEADGSISARLHVAEDESGERPRNLAPAKQAREQARRLSTLLGRHLGSAPWVQSCVFYSHENAFVKVAKEDRAPESNATTLVASGTDALSAIVQQFVGESRRSRHTTEQIVSALEPHATDVTWVGTSS